MREEADSSSLWFKVFSDHTPIIWRVSSTIVWRMIQTLIVIPSTIIATIFFVSVVSGENTTHEIITGFYDFAENSVRPAQPGHVIHRECADQPQPPPENTLRQSTKYDSPVHCQSFKNTEVLITDEVVNATAMIRTLYWVLVGTSFTVLVLLYPGRPFIGLRSAIEEINVKVM